MCANAASAVGDRPVQSNWVGSQECIFILLLHGGVLKTVRGAHGNVGTSVFYSPIPAFGWKSSDTLSVRNSGEYRRKSRHRHYQNKNEHDAIYDQKTAVVRRFSLNLLGFQLHTHECFLAAGNLGFSFLNLLNIIIKIFLQFVVLIALVQVDTAADEHDYANTESKHLK